MTDESNIALWFWFVLIVGVNATWIAMDVWLKRHGHEYLTTEIREILAAGGWNGVLFAAAVGATFGVAYYHFFWQR